MADKKPDVTQYIPVNIAKKQIQNRNHYNLEPIPRINNRKKKSRMDVEKELFAAYTFYAGIVTLKMLIMSPLTTRQRLKTKTFICSEDIAPPFLSYKTGKNDHVERVRRAHQNDIENIVPFLVLGFLYMFTNPEYSTALFLYRLFVGARVLHTIVYLFVIPQPARALTFFANLGVNIYMAYRIIVTFM